MDEFGGRTSLVVGSSFQNQKRTSLVDGRVSFLSQLLCYYSHDQNVNSQAHQAEELLSSVESLGSISELTCDGHAESNKTSGVPTIFVCTEVIFSKDP